MDETPQLPKRETDADAIRSIEHARGAVQRNVALTAAAIVIVLAAFVAIRALDRPARPPHPGADAAPIAANASDTERRAARPIRIPVERGAAPASVGEKPAQGEAGKTRAETAEQAPAIDAADYIAALRAAGETEGLAAFNPPGTRPPEPGVIVPDDYQLPEGFMRHYQSTDDGRQLAPVLTLAPGYELVDENGNALALGRDRIVPPELAPPDLPVRILEVPSTGHRTQGTR